MIPIVELRGAIPFAMSKSLWGASALSNWSAFLWAMLGSSLVVPFVALCFVPIINWLKKTKIFRKMAVAIENKVAKHSKKLIDKEDQNQRRKTFWVKVIGVFVFVAVPLPLTGVWTGTAVAVMIGLNFWVSCASVMVGNVVAGLLITLLSSVTDNASTIILIVFGVFLAAVLGWGLIKYLIAKVKSKKESNKVDNVENIVDQNHKEDNNDSVVE